MIYGDVRIVAVRCMVSGVLIKVMVSGKWCLQYCTVQYGKYRNDAVINRNCGVVLLWNGVGIRNDYNELYRLCGAVGKTRFMVRRLL